MKARAGLLALAVAVAAGVATVATPPPAAADPANVAPPGANRWDCRPSASRPRPVVLVHGLGANMASNWPYLSPVLAGAGWCVFALTYGVAPGTPFPLDQLGGLAPMERSAAELAAFVDRVRAATGAPEVDLVAHSEGTVVSRWYLKYLGGASKVAHLVALTPLYRGTDLVGLATVRAAGAALAPDLVALVESLVAVPCGSCPQFLTGSAFLEELNRDGFTSPGVEYTNIVTRYDALVVPHTSGLLGPGQAHDVVLQDRCSLDYADHVSVAFDPVAARAVMDALSGSPGPATCGLVLPFVGAPWAG